uniref:Uncharacterized protein n=1 Tax=Knipowitschia caucasica TaxID=637954 RepID=A0AAV2KCL8_KNICA
MGSAIHAFTPSPQLPECLNNIPAARMKQPLHCCLRSATFEVQIETSSFSFPSQKMYETSSEKGRRRGETEGYPSTLPSPLLPLHLKLKFPDRKSLLDTSHALIFRSCAVFFSF